MKQISLILPVYNVEKYIRKCIESIISQDFKDFELILVDDGSEDESINIAKSLLYDSGIEYYLYTKTNGGVSSARNFGLEKSNSKYVIFVDSDDVICSNYLSLLYDNIIKTGSDIAICNYKYIDKQELFLQKQNNVNIYSRDAFKEKFLSRSLDFILPTMLINKRILSTNNIIFNVETAFSEDQQFMWECILSSKKISYSNVKAYGYYLRPCSTMTASNYNKIINGYHSFVSFSKSVLCKYNVESDFRDKVLSRWIVGASLTCAKNLSFLEYKKALHEMWNKRIVTNMFEIGEIKAISLSILIQLSKKISYFICREVL